MIPSSTMTTLTEAHIEQTVLAWFAVLGWLTTHPPDPSPAPVWRSSPN